MKGVQTPRKNRSEMVRITGKIKRVLDSGDFSLLRKIIFYHKVAPHIISNLETYTNLVAKIQYLIMRLPVHFRGYVHKSLIGY